MHMNLLKTRVEAEIEIRMIDAYVALIGEKVGNKIIYILTFMSWFPWTSKIIKQKFKDLINLDLFLTAHLQKNQSRKTRRMWALASAKP